MMTIIPLDNWVAVYKDPDEEGAFIVDRSVFMMTDDEGMPYHVSDASFKSIAEAKRADYAAKGHSLSEVDAIHEVVAEFTERCLFNDEQALNDLVRNDRNLAEKLLHYIQDFIHNITDDKITREIRQAEKLLRKALQESAAREEQRHQAALKGVETRERKAAAEGRAANRLANDFSIDGSSDSRAVVWDDKGNLVAWKDADTGGTYFSEATFEGTEHFKGGRQILKESLAKMVEKGQLTQESADEMMAEMERYYQMAKEIRQKGRTLIDYGNWAIADIRLDENGKTVLTCVVKNSEYRMNIDFSTVCKKRATLDRVLNRLVTDNTFRNSKLLPEDIAMINDKIREHGFEVSCGLCFVDAKRYAIQQWADTFTDPYNKMVKAFMGDADPGEFNFSHADGRRNGDGKTFDYEAGCERLRALLKTDAFCTDSKGVVTPGKTKQIYQRMGQLIIGYKTNGKGVVKGKYNAQLSKRAAHYMNSADLISSVGMVGMKTNFPELYEVLKPHWGSAKPKTSLSETPYQNEIILGTKGEDGVMVNFTWEKAFDIGGVRLQSFSDYRANMYFDYMQAICDLAAKSLCAQAYTKEPAFAKLFGMTGVKINMSLLCQVEEADLKYLRSIDSKTLAKIKSGEIKNERVEEILRRVGLDSEGNYVWGTETFDPQEAFRIQSLDGYGKNCGTICVGISYDHVIKMLADKNIRMVIPYHRSGLNHLVAIRVNSEFFSDYEPFQNECNAKTGDKVKNPKVSFYDILNRNTKAAFAVKGNGQQAALDAVPQKTSVDFVRACEEAGYRPRFPQFAYVINDGSTTVQYSNTMPGFEGKWMPSNVEYGEDGYPVVRDGYYKVLEDYTLVDNHGHYTGYQHSLAQSRVKKGTKAKMVTQYAAQDTVHLNFPQRIRAGVEVQQTGKAGKTMSMENYIVSTLEDHQMTQNRLDSDMQSLTDDILDEYQRSNEQRAMANRYDLGLESITMKQARESRRKQNAVSDTLGLRFSSGNGAAITKEQLAAVKEEQNRIIQSSNAAHDGYHTWIRSADDILTYQEAIAEEGYGAAPDFTEAQQKAALKSGRVTVYSSNRIANGTFVTPSRMEAQSYAGNAKLYNKTVNLSDVAWIDTIQGQYAPVDTGLRYSADNGGQITHDQLAGIDNATLNGGTIATKGGKANGQRRTVGESVGSRRLLSGYNSSGTIQPAGGRTSETGLASVRNTGDSNADFKGYAKSSDFSAQISDNSGVNNVRETGISDADYKAAAKVAPDVARMMLKEVAKAAGYTRRLFHGTNAMFYAFKLMSEGIHIGDIAQANDAANYKDSLWHGKHTLRQATESIMHTPNMMDVASFIEEAQTAYREKFGSDFPFRGDVFSESDAVQYCRDMYSNISEYYGWKEANGFKINFDNVKNSSINRTISAFVKMGKVATIETDLGDWSSHNLCSLLIDYINRDIHYSDGFDAVFDTSKMKGFEQLSAADIPELHRMSRNKTFDELAGFLENRGINTIRYINRYEGDQNSESFIVMNPNQVKSTEITYYPGTNEPIELSKRFSESDDFRYSSGNGAPITKEQLAGDTTDMADLTARAIAARQERQLEHAYGFGYADATDEAESRAAAQRFKDKQKHHNRVSNIYESHRKTALRNEIKDRTAWFTKRVLHPTETSHIPAGMVKSCRDIAELMNFEIGAGSRTTKKTGNITAKLDELISQIRGVSAEIDSAVYQDFYASGVQTLAENLVDELRASNHTVSDMSEQELNAVNDLLKAMKKLALEAGTVELNGKRMEVSKMSNESAGEVTRSPGVNKHNPIAMQKVKLDIDLSTPKTFINMISNWENGKLNAMREAVNDGCRKMYQYQMEIAQMFQTVTDNAAEMKAFTGRGANKNMVSGLGLVDSNGKEVSITHAQLCSLWMHLQSEDNQRHILRGGLSIPDAKLYNAGNISEANAAVHRVRVQDAQALLDSVESQMTDFDRAWCKIAKTFFNDYCKKLINQTSRELVGFDKAGVENYFPIISDKNFSQRTFDSVMHDGSIEGVGFLKERHSGANPIMLFDINQVVNRQADGVSRYAGLAIPVRTFSNVWGYSGGDWAMTLRGEVADKWGNSAVKYVDKWMADIQFGSTVDGSNHAAMLGSLRGNYAQAVLTMNPTSALSQVSLMSAAPITGMGATSKALFDLLKYATPGGRGRLNAINAEIAEHSPMMWIRKKGSTGELYDFNQSTSIVSSILKAPGINKFTSWIARMDENTIAAVWSAAKYAAAEKGLAEGSKEYWDTVTDLFNRAVEESQPNYTPQQMTQISRAKDGVSRALTMFKSPFMSTSNLSRDAIGRLKATMSSTSAATEQEKSEACKAVAVTAASQLTQAMMSATLRVAALGLVFHKWDDDRDDEGNVTLMATIENIGWKTLSNMISQHFPVLVGDIYDAVQSGIMGTYYYGGVGTGALDSLADALSDVQALIDDGATSKEIMNAVTDTFTLIGLPAIEVKNWVKSFMAYADGIKQGDILNGGYTTTAANATAAVGNAVSGKKDIENAQAIVDRYFSTSTAVDPVTSLRQALAKKYKDQYIAADDSERQRLANVLTGIKGTDGKAIYTEEELTAWVNDSKTDAVRGDIAAAVNEAYTSSPIYSSYMSEEQQEATDAYAKKLTTYLAKVKAGVIEYDDDEYTAVSAAVKAIYEKHGDDVNSYMEYVLVHGITTGIESDKDAKGETVKGSKKKKMIAALKSAGYTSQVAESLYDEYLK